MAQTSEDKILKTLKKEGKPLKSGEIAELTSLEKNDVTKAIKKLTTDGKVVSPKRCFYEAVK
ncbi:MAG: MarR family transcriptional regulator [Spirochaetota bacterium]